MNKIRVYPHRACISEKSYMFLKKKIEDKMVSTANGNLKKMLQKTKGTIVKRKSGKGQKVQYGRKNKTFIRNSRYFRKLQFPEELKDWRMIWKMNLFPGQKKQE